MRTKRQLLAAGALLALAACTQTQGVEMASRDSLPRPQVVIVEDFAVSPGEVQLDRGISASIDRALGAGGPPPAEKERELARQVQQDLAEKLTVEIRDLGLRAERGRGLPPGVREGIVITGQFLAVDQGNQAERVAIGLGAGRSDVNIQAQVFEVTPAGRRLVDEAEVDAKSGLTPGMAETMGAGALAGHLLVSTLVSGGVQVASETMGDTVVADTNRAAKGLAKQLGGFFAKQGWTE